MTVGIGEDYRVTARMQDNYGNDIMGVYYWQTGGTGTSSDSAFLAAIETELTAMYTAIQGGISNQVNPVDISVDEVDYVSGKWTVTRHVGTIPWTAWGGGTGSSDMLPQACSGLVTATTATTKVYGRKYVGPLIEGGQAEGQITSTILTALAAFGVEWLSDFTFGGTLTAFATVASKKTGTARELLSSIVSSVIAYQRRRKTGRGS